MQPPNPLIEKFRKLSIQGQTDEPQNPLQQGIDKTGAGFQLPQLAPQVPQGQLQPQIPQAPQQSLATEPEGIVPETYNAAMLGVPDFDKPYIIPQAAQAFEAARMADEARPRQGRQAKPFGTTPTAPTFGSPSAGLRTGRGGARRGAKLELSAPVAEPSPLLDPAAASDPASFADTSTGIGMLPQPYLQATDTRTPADISQAQAPIAPTAPTQGLTTMGGQPLSEFLAGGQQLDPQGRMIDPSVDRSFFEEQSAAREARAAEQFGVARGPDAMDREAGELSMADARDLANLRDPRATEGERARAMQVAERLGRDPATGKEIATDDMTDYQKATLAQRQQQFEATQANINREWEAGQAALAEEKAQGIATTQESIQKETDRLDSQLGFLEGAAMEMAGLSKWSTEGIIGAGIGKLPFETNKKQVDRIANSFMGNAFLRSIIDSKSLGATFGALSNQEGEKITGAETILMDASMSNERRLRAAADIISTIKSAKSRAEQRMAKTKGGGQSAPSGDSGSATPQMEGFTFKVK